MNKNHNILDNLVLDPAVMFKDASACRVHKEVMQEIREEVSSQFVDEFQVRDNEDWSFLADKVVGAELSQS